MDWGFGVLARGAGLAVVLTFLVWVAGAAFILANTSDGGTIAGYSRFGASAIWCALFMMVLIAIGSLQVMSAGAKYIEHLNNEKLREEGKLQD